MDVELAGLHSQDVIEAITGDDDQVGYDLHVYAKYKFAAPEDDTDNPDPVVNGIRISEYPNPKFTKYLKKTDTISCMIMLNLLALRPNRAACITIRKKLYKMMKLPRVRFVNIIDKLY